MVPQIFFQHDRSWPLPTYGTQNHWYPEPPDNLSLIIERSECNFVCIAAHQVCKGQQKSHMSSMLHLSRVVLLNLLLKLPTQRSPKPDKYYVF